MLKGAEVMTDYQYESIIKMVLLIVDEAKDVKDIKKKLESLLRNRKRDADDNSEN
jgi:hypothetical protein